MFPSPSRRGLTIAGLVLVAILVISFSAVGATVQRLMYVGYGLAIPVMFGLFVLGGVYYGVRHLITA